MSWQEFLESAIKSCDDAISTADTLKKSQLIALGKVLLNGFGQSLGGYGQWLWNFDVMTEIKDETLREMIKGLAAALKVLRQYDLTITEKVYKELNVQIPEVEELENFGTI